MRKKPYLYILLLIGHFLWCVAITNNYASAEEKTFLAEESLDPEGTSCMKFHGFYNPSKEVSPDACRQKNEVYTSNPNKTITFKWDCPIKDGIPSFYWFCCSCKDNTSYTVPVPFPIPGVPCPVLPVSCKLEDNPNNDYISASCTLTVDPNHEYAYSVACPLKAGVMSGCGDKLRVIKYKK
ncbi:MAG: hypothetical protein M0R48_01180 [Candidatus Omnitrophica bacterium]|nr:hypothetical protein [Candidatus Omnitrophota bacterium]